MRRYEELHCWQEARELVKSIYLITNQGFFKRDFGLKDQIQRAAVSVMANIAEGYNTISNIELIKFLGYSCRSAAEVSSHLYVALDIGYIDKYIFDNLQKQTDKTNRLIRALIKYKKTN